MKTVRVMGAALAAAAAELVEVEAHFDDSRREQTQIVLTGLPDAVMRESRGRLMAALRASGLPLPSGKLHLNLLPAGRPKAGEILDLAMALAAAAAAGHLEPRRLGGAVFLGGLGIDGRLQDVPGGLAAALAARDAGHAEIIAAPRTAAEAGAVPGVRARAARHLGDVVGYLAGYTESLALVCALEEPEARGPQAAAPPTLADVRGQARAKRALLVAAAGGHPLLLLGPPGTGKTMLARVLPGLLPAPGIDERLEMTRVLSAAAQWPRGLVRERPFRAPHHTTSYAGLIGGGNPPRAGEVTRAHGGVLFLDELPEFRRDVLETLRQPLEAGRVLVARAGGELDLPCRFQLVAAMNPCPCGYHGSPRVRCRCTPGAIARYRAHVSGPLLDRIDLRVELPAPAVTELLPPKQPPESRASPDAARAAILRAREQAARRELAPSNALLAPGQLDACVPLAKDLRAVLERAADERGLSARALQSLRRVARTTADLEGAAHVTAAHVAEALALRDPVGV